MNNKTIRWGIIGCGNVTELKSGPAYQKTEGFELVAVMRRDAALAEDYAKRHGVPTFYSDADALIGDPNVDAVYIATPPDTHLFYALKVAAAGKTCCIEKPMACNYNECLAICDAFEKQNVPLFVAYYRRSLPRFQHIKTLLDSGAIGEVRSVHWQLSKPASEKDRSGGYNWRTDAKIAPGGYFDDLASHGLDLFVYLFGAVRQVHGIGTNQQQLYSAKDALAGCWLHSSGVTGSGTWNFGSYTREDHVAITGSAGSIAFSVFDELPIVLRQADQSQEFSIPHPENIQLFHVQNMREFLVHGIPHPSTGRTAAHTSWIMDQIIGG
ncbi:Gfo/Idh/MocA family oxidoreductase [Flavobacterium sp.]|uniref:Gfo/Idh/MocA family protein n=1 Tax=Flavobacterium sp. TaxID=239 RepID=UPI00260D75A4|nr:Gfo/Idh/MocA family oxidoreductase [Flavobacterium sp.]